MYRLPSQFDPAGQQSDLSAAGGGSTSTTCSSCLVTLGAASVVTSAIFGGLIPPERSRTVEGSIPPTAPIPEPSPLPQITDAADNADPRLQATAEDTLRPAPAAADATAAAMPESVETIAAPPRRRDSGAPLINPLSTTERRIWGALAIALALAAGVVTFLIQPVFGAIVFFAVYIGIFCFVYERSNLSPGRGALTAIGMLIGISICAAFEMYVWINNM